MNDKLHKKKNQENYIDNNIDSDEDKVVTLESKKTLAKLGIQTGAKDIAPAHDIADPDTNTKTKKKKTRFVGIKLIGEAHKDRKTVRVKESKLLEELDGEDVLRQHLKIGLLDGKYDPVTNERIYDEEEIEELIARLDDDPDHIDEVTGEKTIKNLPKQKWSAENVVVKVESKPINAQDLYGYVAEAISENPRLIFDEAEHKGYLFNGASFQENYIFDKWVLDVCRAMGDTANSGIDTASKGTLKQIIKQAMRADRKFAEMKAGGRCKGVPLADAQLIWDKELRTWATLPHSPANRNFMHLDVTTEEILAMKKANKPLVSRDFKVNPKDITTVTDASGVTLLEYNGKRYENMDELTFEEETVKKFPYLVKDDGELTILGTFLKNSFTADQIYVLMQWLGYHLVKHFKDLPNQERFLHMQGQGQNGKSRILHLIKALVGGNKGCVWLSMDNLNMRTMVRAIGKRALVSSETDGNLPLNDLKAMVSGEERYAEQKYLTGVMFEPDFLITIASNSIPIYADRSGAIERRLIYFPLKAVPNSKRIADVDKLIISQELVQLTLFALDGAEVLLERHFIKEEKVAFDIPESVAEESRRVAKQSDQVNSYAEDCLDFSDPNACVAHEELWKHHVRWAKDNGKKNPLGTQALIDEVIRTANAMGKPVYLPKSPKEDYEFSRWLDENNLANWVIGRKPPGKIKVIYGVRIQDGEYGTTGNNDTTVGIGMKNGKTKGKYNRKNENSTDAPSDDSEGDDYQDVPF